MSFDTLEIVRARGVYEQLKTRSSPLQICRTFISFMAKKYCLAFNQCCHWQQCSLFSQCCHWQQCSFFSQRYQWQQRSFFSQRYQWQQRSFFGWHFHWQRCMTSCSAACKNLQSYELMIFSRIFFTKSLIFSSDTGWAEARGSGFHSCCSGR